ncbi:SinR family protein [Pseudoxanthomonas winnipegensis]|uniref:SinR family protein n=1 Tax=Pseudoxanthomonas winnipegensis TaxID=2480810 RepID=A0A4Q8M1X9_9GAMM|nr:SinR family protein [Pseudoxanthomonas winnipegensis]TAA38522.1 SinR family protein [Pseudoxanthomonas winnipegensis]
MAIYMVGYDLRKAGQDYTGLINKIKDISDGYLHHLDSTWLIGHLGSASAIRDALKPHLDSNDKLLVVQVAKGEWATSGFSAAANTWLRNHVET